MRWPGKGLRVQPQPRSGAGLFPQSREPDTWLTIGERCLLDLRRSLAAAAKKDIEVITFVQKQGASKPLIDTTKWTSHGSPYTLEH
jgi:hypothetical protein